jgi:hypothetical protein
MNKPELVERVARAMCETSKTVPRADFRVLATAAIEELGVEKLVAALKSAKRTLRNLQMIAGDGTAVSLQAAAEEGAIDEALSSLSKGRG